ncbi:MAG: hypothetical protein GF364_19055 [Candidatus Lokiarchaeota archaeon]|nr:hypothetical protein [Candidatus Lokiarchaeota archaeon]
MREKIIDNSLTDILEEFKKILVKQYKITEIDEKYFSSILSEVEERYRKYRYSEENWKFFPGKEIRRKIDNSIKLKCNITIDWNVIKKRALKSSLAEEFRSQIANYLKDL